jgi:hypothetical protein
MQHLLLAQLLLLAPLLRTNDDGSGGGGTSGGAAHHVDLLSTALPNSRGATATTTADAATTATPATTTADADAADDPGADTGIAPRGIVSGVSLHGPTLALLTARLPTFLWWGLRAVGSHQHVLTSGSASLLSRASLLSARLLAWVGWDSGAAAAAQGASASDASNASGASGKGATVPSSEDPARPPPELRGALLLELALQQYGYGYIDRAHKYLCGAGDALGLQVSLGGAMGRRTVHQVDAKAQLVVRATRARGGGAGEHAAPDAPVGSLGLRPEGVTVAATATAGGAAVGASEGGGGGSGGSGGSGGGACVVPPAPLRDTAGMAEMQEADVLPAPVLVGEDDQVLESHYSGLEQVCVCVCAFCQRVLEARRR